MTLKIYPIDKLYGQTIIKFNKIIRPRSVYSIDFNYIIINMTKLENKKESDVI